MDKDDVLVVSERAVMLNSPKRDTFSANAVACRAWNMVDSFSSWVCIYMHDTSECPLIYLGNTLNVVTVFQFHDNVLHNSSRCPHVDDLLHSISTVSSTTI